MSSSSAFDLLSEPIRSLARARGLLAPSEIQERAIPVILRGESALLISPTGSGKTEAAMLPIFDLMLREERKGISTLYITPLRALNRDLLDRLSWWAQKLDLRMAVRHGDTEKAERRQQVLAPPNLLITTPETLQIILVARRLRELLRGVRHVVIDEVHELANDKRGTQLVVSLRRLERLAQRPLQIVGLSATIGNAEEVARFLVGRGREIRVVSAFPRKAFSFKIIYHRAKEEVDSPLLPDLYVRLQELLKEVRGKKALIFTNTRSEAESLASKIRIVDPGYPVAIHHGSLSAESRSSAELGIKHGNVSGVICTSSLELGIDIGDLDLIVQYNSPRQASKLIQRTGRSGHSLQKVSRGVIIVQDSDDALEAAVLARMGSEGTVEPIIIPEKPYDVMMQQIAGMIMESLVMKVDEIYGILRETYPYRGLSYDELNRLIDYMANRKPPLVRYREGAVMKPSRSGPLYEYYFSNLSMIPEEVNYVVIDEERDEPVGLLDESFVSEYGEIGTKFILAGSAWIITNIVENRVYVRGASDPIGAVPSWIGEEIPVVKEVAQEVGRIRGELAEIVKSRGVDEAVKYLVERFPMDEESAMNAVNEIALQVRRGLPVPSDRVVTIESHNPYIIIHTHLGLLENRTLARMLSYLIGIETARMVKVKNDPYRIILEAPNVDASAAERIFMSLKDYDLEDLARKSCEGTGLFRRRLIQAARKMGVIEPHVMITLSDAKVLAETLKGTPVYEEAFRTMLEQDLNWRAVQELITSILRGERRLVNLGELDEPTPLALIGLEELARQGEVVDPARLKRLIIEGGRARSLGCVKTAYCLSCGAIYAVQPYYMGDPPRCEQCGSTRIALLEEPEDVVSERVSRDSSYVREAERIAEFVERHGRRGAIALCFNVPRSTAEEILKVQDEDQFFYMLMEAERKRSLSLLKFRKR
ncbi:MAG: DEAD/DEAH box helicase [Nitrososphaeria archaeon]